MNLKKNIFDYFLFFVLVLVVLGMPFGLKAYDNKVRQDKLPPGAKEFTLTGHSQKGWLGGEVLAYDVISLWNKKKSFERPVLQVTKGDQVVLHLKSSDVIHGFSLKDFNVFVNPGIFPGKDTTVSFKADKEGTFTFSCNVICGENHKNMQGTLRVKG